MPRKKQGSLKHQLTATLLEGLAKIGCTKGEAADALGVSHEHLSRARPELKDAWARGAANGKVSLRRMQWKHARMRNAAGVSMNIHMSKHLLGQHDKALIEVTHTSRVEVIHQLLREIDGQSKGLPTFAKANEPPKMLDLLPDASKVPERVQGCLDFADRGQGLFCSAAAGSRRGARHRTIRRFEKRDIPE